MELRQCGGKDVFTTDPQTGENIVTRQTPIYMQLTISGKIRNASDTDCVYGGQCLDEIAKCRSQLSDPETFDVLYDLWKNYHLNGHHAGTPEQEKAVEEWLQAGEPYDYTAACEMLKEKGLYEVNFTGITVGRKFENEPYKYGYGWVVQELPDDVIQKVKSILAA